MRAVICRTLGKPAELVVEEIDSPNPGEGEVKVAVKAAGVNYVDVLMVAGEYQHRPDPPFIPGLEGAGEVLEVGPGVAGLKPAERVITNHLPGAFAEEVVVEADKAVPIPDNMDFVNAAAFRSAFNTAYHALVHRGNLRAGESLLVHGASGGIGLAAVQVGKVLGATVIATGGSDDKLAVVESLGADHVVNYQTTPRFRDPVKDLTGGRGVDVVYDPVGGDVFDESTRCLNMGARMLVLGFTSGRPALAKTNQMLIKVASVIGVRVGDYSRRDPAGARAMTETLLDWYAQGRIKAHVSHVLRLDQVQEALDLIAQRKVIGKAVLSDGATRM